jgi:hypothetical protein
MLPQLAQGDANKVFVIPAEFPEAFGSITKAFAASKTVLSENAGGPHAS